MLRKSFKTKSYLTKFKKELTFLRKWTFFAMVGMCNCKNHVSLKEIFPDSFAICGKKKQKSKDTQDVQKQPQCVRSLQLKSCPNLSKLKGSTLQEGHLFNFFSFKDKKKSFSILFCKFHLFGGHIGYFFSKVDHTLLQKWFLRSSSLNWGSNSLDEKP